MEGRRDTCCPLGGTASYQVYPDVCVEDKKYTLFKGLLPHKNLPIMKGYFISDTHIGGLTFEHKELPQWRNKYLWIQLII